MKRTPLLLTLGLVFLMIGGFVVYHYFFKKTHLSVWDIIPEQTVLVYEVGDCETCIEKVKSSAMGELFKNVFFDISQQDSLRKSLDFLSTPVKGEVISLHITRKDDFDLIYYFPEQQARHFENSIRAWKGKKGIRFSERVLNGVKIQEYTFGSKLLSWAQLDNIWVGSFTPFLLEDVIRTFTSSDKSTFTSQISEVYMLPRIKNDPGNVFVHLGNFISWLGIFTDGAPNQLELGQASLLDIKQNENSIVLNGFSLTRKAVANSLLSYFENQSPVQFSLKQYISNRTVFATTFGISDGTVFYQNLGLSKSKNTLDSITSIAKIDFTNLFSSFGKEMAVCYSESKGSAFSKVVVFETSKPQDWLESFDRISKAVEKEDTVFYEKYSTYEIREIEMNNFVGKLFNPIVSGFPQTYYTSIGNVIILAERLEEIKQFVDDIDREDVWGKSIAFNKFIESTLLESNLSVYINTPLVWNTLSNKLNPRWKAFISKNSHLLESVNLGAIQFSHLNESFYTNVTWEYRDVGKPKTTQETPKQLVASLNAAIATRPFVVKSHVSKKDEVLVQDSTHQVYHLDSNGKVLWRSSLDEPIIGNVQQVDFFNNGKLQFFFATPGKLHIIDRLGNYVKPFPVQIQIKEMEFTRVIDYDNSKKYRFLIADKSGKLWMYDKEGKNLEGWKPRNVEGNLSTTANHHRIRGKDYILAIRKNGWAFLMNRRGENLKGFPLNLDARPHGDYYVEVGNSVSTTYFVCISRDGFRVKFNLEGKILSRETLVKPTFETQFSLIAEQQNKSYLIARQDAKRLTLLDEEGKEILSNDFIGVNPVSIQYYNFGAGRIYISITDLIQDLSYIYDGKGALLTSPPIEGNAIELRVGDREFPKVFSVDKNTLIIR